MDQKNNFYCSQKFWWLTVDPERRLLASCCKADSEEINIQWLKNNPGKLFNTPNLQSEREMLLAGKCAPSCVTPCYKPESQGIPSQRILSKSNEVTHTSINATPRVVEINLGSDCNMTCVYCTKRYSSAWLRDAAANTYLDAPRFNITNEDKLLLKLSQNTIKDSSQYQTIVNEVKSLTGVQTLKFSGGEPFLYNTLVDLVTDMNASDVIINTGLGVNPTRFERLLSKLDNTTVQLAISAENVGKLYEFNRNGNTFNNFLENLNTVIKYKFKYRFSSTLSNTTIHGFKEFQNEFATPDDFINIVIDPTYQATHIIDEASKNSLLQLDYKYHDSEIKQSLGSISSQADIDNFKEYIVKFSTYRNLSLDIFPVSFTKWIQQ